MEHLNRTVRLSQTNFVLVGVLYRLRKGTCMRRARLSQAQTATTAAQIAIPQKLSQLPDTDYNSEAEAMKVDSAEQTQ
eukprot:1055181-Amphidinium_carterae.1